MGLSPVQLATTSSYLSCSYHCHCSVIIAKLLLYVQTIRNDHQGVTNFTRSCKTALYREFLKCGVATWETVIDALENCNECNIAEQVMIKLQQRNEQ